MVTKMQVENTLGRGWNKLPKNRTDAKLKIFERLLAMRKLVNDEYVLDQDRLIGMLSNVWVSVNPATNIHHNDHI